MSKVPYTSTKNYHLQKAYEQEEVVSFLYEAGFSSVCVLDAETMDEVKEDTQRLYYIDKIERKKDERLYYQSNCSE